MITTKSNHLMEVLLKHIKEQSLEARVLESTVISYVKYCHCDNRMEHTITAVSDYR